MRRFLLIAVVACGGSSSSSSTTTTGTSALIVKASGGQSLTIASPGGSVQLGAFQSESAGYGGGTTLVEVTASWSSSAVSVATVNTTGLVTAVAAGSADITATAGSSTGKATVTVGMPPPAATTIDWNLGSTAATNTVTAGTAVKWHNTDGVTHTLVADAAPPPDTVSLSGGATSPAQTITAKGTYHYHCSIHSSMHGTLVVQ